MAEALQHETHEGGVPEALHVPPAYEKFVPVAMGWITIFIIFFLAAVGLRKFRQVPRGLQAAWEFTYEWVEDIVLQVMGKQGMAYFPLFFSFFLFILISNFLGLLPLMMSPTSKLDTTVALALWAFFSIHLLGMRQKGFFGYWGHFFHVVDASKESGLMKVIMLPLQFVILPAIELIGELARPLSLSMRLFGNIMAKEILLGVLASILLTFYQTPGAINKILLLVPLVMRPGILVLGVLVSIIQAVVFTVLSMIYIGGAIAHEEHSEKHEHAEGHATTAA